MNILHCIPRSDSGSIRQTLLDDLFSFNTQDLSNYVLTDKSQQSEFAARVGTDKVYCFSSSRIWARGGKKQFRHVVAATSAEIIHIHSFADLYSLQIMRWAFAMRIPVVFSPYNSMMPWHLSNIPLPLRLKRTIVSRMLLKHTGATVLTSSNQETERMKQMFRHALGSSGRLSVATRIKSINGEADTPRLASTMFSVYRKIIDSNPFWLMSEKDVYIENGLAALGAILSSGKDADTVFLPLQKIKSELATLSAEHWRRIQLHSSDQDILPEVRMAYESLMGTPGGFDPQTVDRHSVVAFRSELKRDKPSIKTSRMHQVSEDYSEYKSELLLCVMLLNMKHLTDTRRVTRRNLSDLYLYARFEDYNEYVLEEMLSDLGILEFSSRILTLLVHSMFLEKGHVPVKLSREKDLCKMQKQLFKSNIM